MPRNPTRSAVLWRRAAPCAVLLACLAPAVLAQKFPTLQPNPQQQPTWVPPRPPGPQGAQQPPPAPPAGQAPGPVIARVEGRPISQMEFDRIAGPYYARLQAQLGASFNDDIRKIAKINVLNELIRRELLVIEAERQKPTVTEAETDQILMQDPLFLTNGRFDPEKLRRFKLDPASNYQQILPRVRQVAAVEKIDSGLRAQFTPSAAALRAEWSKRNEQVRFKLLPLLTREVSLDGEATAEQRAAYYAAHPDEFERKPRLALRYVKLPLPPDGDSTRAATLVAARARAERLADSLRAGTPIDSLGADLVAMDTGPYDIPAQAVPGIGPTEELPDAFRRVETDTNLRVIGPVELPDAFVLATVSERQPKKLPPIEEVFAEVKRRADNEQRRLQSEREREAFYAAHQDTFRTRRVQLARVVLPDAQVSVPAPKPRDVEAWYATHGATLRAPGDTAGATPALTDSLRRVVAERIGEEGRRARVEDVLARIARDWSAGRDIRGAARSARATYDTLTLARGGPPDSVFPARLVDSLLTDPARVNAVQGPRRLGARGVVWRVSRLDTTFVPPFDAVRTRLDAMVQDQKRRKDEDEARVHFDAHRADYKTPPRFVIDYVRVPILPADSVRITEGELAAFHTRNRERFSDPERVRARHILIATDQRTPGGDRAARARADSLRQAIVGGADFADLARRFSHDQGSGAAGGDLGAFGRGRMVKEFEDTSFALPAGAVSQPVKTQFGWHVIKVDEHMPERVKPLDEVRESIRLELARGRTDSLARRSANAVRRQLARGAPAATVTQPYGGVLTSTPFAANDPVPGLGRMPELSADLPKLAAGQWAAKAYKADQGWVVVRLGKRVPPGPAEFDEVRRQAVEDMKNAKRREILAGRLESVRTRLAAGATLDTVARELGGLKDSGLLTQAAGFVPFLGAEPRVVEKAFTMKTGATSDTIHVAQGYVWIRPEERKTPEGASFQRDRQAIEGELVAKRYEEWLARKRKTVKIEILRPDLRETPPPPIVTQTFTTGGR